MLVHSSSGWIKEMDTSVRGHQSSARAPATWKWLGCNLELRKEMSSSLAIMHISERHC